MANFPNILGKVLHIRNAQRPCDPPQELFVISVMETDQVDLFDIMVYPQQLRLAEIRAQQERDDAAQSAPPAPPAPRRCINCDNYADGEYEKRDPRGGATSGSMCRECAHLKGFNYVRPRIRIVDNQTLVLG